ncbi:MAG: hypothetical protein OEU26_33180, partial [Candidatus Tectomicrobia bacterium]|nr:hypothetical protein [Candidatus Tectomicrobia bacterium]
RAPMPERHSVPAQEVTAASPRASPFAAAARPSEPRHRVTLEHRSASHIAAVALKGHSEYWHQVT